MKKTDVIIQIGNITPPRKGFDNPQEGRVYSIEGVAPCIRKADARYYIVVNEEDIKLRNKRKE